MNLATAALNAMLMEAIQREANLRIENLALKQQIAELQAAAPKRGPKK